MITMKKWGTKSEIGGAIMFTAIAVDAFSDLNPYLLIISAITGLILVFYDWFINKKSK